MTNTATTSNIVDQSTTAHFNAWFNEVITALFTTLTLTQTGDTGQISTGGSVAIPSTQTSAGYVIGRFNDTLQSTVPIFFKLEFGTGATSAGPQMWLTVGTGSNGSGTITGTTISTRGAVLNGSAPASTSTSYTSRFAYNATYGIAWMAFKLGGVTGGNAMGAFFINRSTDATGATTGKGVDVTVNSLATNGSSTSGGVRQSLAFDTGAVIGATGTTSIAWGAWPMLTTTTSDGGNVSVIPCFGAYPFLGYNSQLALGLVGEIAIGSTYSLAMIGATALTYISLGCCFGSSVLLAANGTGINTLNALWQ
jgi:hypothetical protein